MIVDHKMLCPEGTDSWALNCPEWARAAAAGLGRVVGEAIFQAAYGGLRGVLRRVVHNCPYLQAIGKAGLTDGYG